MTAAVYLVAWSVVVGRGWKINDEAQEGTCIVKSFKQLRPSNWRHCSGCNDYSMCEANIQVKTSTFESVTLPAAEVWFIGSYQHCEEMFEANTFTCMFTISKSNGVLSIWNRQITAWNAKVDAGEKSALWETEDHYVIVASIAGSVTFCSLVFFCIGLKCIFSPSGVISTQRRKVAVPVPTCEMTKPDFHEANSMSLVQTPDLSEFCDPVEVNSQESEFFQV